MEIFNTKHDLINIYENNGSKAYLFGDTINKNYYAILCEINHLVEEGISTLSGHIRKLPVTIGGSTYIPPIPLEYQVKEELNELLNKDISIDTGIELILYVMKKQDRYSLWENMHLQKMMYTELWVQKFQRMKS